MTHTRFNRTRILASRPASIQVNFLGFLGTMGASFIDYIIVDPFVAPPSQQAFYSEKLVHLDGGWWPAEITWDIANDARERCVYGLPEDVFVFCCFNTSYKITPQMFNVWMRILRAVRSRRAMARKHEQHRPGKLTRRSCTAAARSASARLRPARVDGRLSRSPPPCKPVPRYSSL